MSRLRPPRILLLSWLALLILLALTVTLAHVPLGTLNFPISLAIAATKAAIVAVIFMELREGRRLTIGFAVAGILWLGIMLWLASMDFLSRSQGTLLR